MIMLKPTYIFQSRTTSLHRKAKRRDLSASCCDAAHRHQRVPQRPILVLQGSTNAAANAPPKNNYARKTLMLRENLAKRISLLAEIRKNIFVVLVCNIFYKLAKNPD